MYLNLFFLLVVSCAILRSSKAKVTSIMSSQTFAQVNSLSLEMLDPPRASRAMHSTLCSNLKLTKKVLTVNLLSEMVRLGIGTNEVENYAFKMSKQSVRKGRNVT